MNKTTVLIVEDEAIVAADLAGKLEQGGYEVVGNAATGEEAIALACRLRPQVVLMDIWLKGTMDGIAAAQAILKQHDIPIIYLTAHSDTATLERAKLTGPFGYILKPFEERELATQIEMAIYKHQAEWELRQQREWLRVTLTSIGDGVITCDTDQRVTFINPVAERLSGWKTEEALGQPIQSVFKIINERTRQPAEDIVGRVLREKIIVELANHTALVTKDGGEVSIEDSAAPIMDRDGNVVGVVLVFHNVTDQRLAREALRRANTELADADRRKDEFLAMLAHELRNPLAPVRYAVQILRMPEVPESARQRQQSIIDRQVTHMSRLLDDLLDVSRVTRGKVELQPQSLCLADVLVHAADTARPICEARHQQFHFAPPPVDLRVEADIDRLAQVVGNLLVNASKFTGEGGQIWLESVREGELAVIRVRDTGIGITPEFLPHIFDLFAQADDPRHRSQGGLGIGLTLVRLLVEMHGGTVAARSAGENQGSEFIIRLPALSRELPEEPEHQTALPEPERNLCRRILVVDDIVDSATSLAEMLAFWGHEARAVHDGGAAIEMVQAWRPDLVLMDIGMPGMDGYETVRRLRAEHGHSGLTLVALTGFGQEADRAAARAAGFDAHLVKPVNISALLDLLGRVDD